MVSPPRRRVRGIYLGFFALAALILIAVGPAVGTLPATAAATGTGVREGSSIAVAEAALAEPFAERAGYSAVQVAEAGPSAAATGSSIVVVTFEPQNASSFFAPPVAGSAPLNLGQIAARFGLSPAAYGQAERYFQSFGLSVVHRWPDRLALSLEGPVGAIDRAFGTSVRSADLEGTPVTYPETPPQLPSSLEGEIGSVLGLSTGFDDFTYGLTPASGPSQGGTNLVTPGIAREIYDLSSLYNVSGSFHSAKGEGIALLLWGDGYSTSDMSTFFSTYYPSSFPAPNVTAYPVDGAPPPTSGPSGDTCTGAQELTLDIEWSGSMAPGANLDAVYAPYGGSNCASPTDASMADALHQAVSLPVAAVSMSFGTPDATSGGLAAAWGIYLSEAVQEGITLLAATGDLGGDADANCQGGPAPEYPSTSPDVLAVGGTDVTLDYSALGALTGFSESGWSQSGGGPSSVYSAPTWQSGTSMRQTPDVSATAAQNFVYYDGQALEAGGTSFATPLWAGLITEMDALHGTPFGLISPRLYSIGEAEQSNGSRVADGLADITSGSNCVASAGPGWDAVTGWGSPRALDLYEDLTATFVNLSVSATPGTVAQGGSVTITGHLANASDGKVIAGVPVQVSLVSTVSIGPCTGTFGSATVTTGALGNVSVAIGVPSCYLGSHASAQVLVTTDGYYGSNATTISVNLFGLFPSLAMIGEYPYSVVTFVVILAAASVVGWALGRRLTRRTPSAPPIGPAAPPPPPDASAMTPAPPPPPGEPSCSGGSESP
jgi:kumamolisin